MLSTAYFNLFDISLHREDWEAASGPGPADEAVEHIVTNEQYVREQLDAINPEFIARELSEYGAWDTEELQDTEQNERRIVWIAAGNIYEEMNE